MGDTGRAANVLVEKTHSKSVFLSITLSFSVCLSVSIMMGGLFFFFKSGSVQRGDVSRLQYNQRQETGQRQILCLLQEETL